MTDFRCPICRCRQYEQHVVETPKGQKATGFHVCCGCSVVFRDPELFTRFDPVGRAAEHVPEPGRGWPKGKG